MLVKFYIDVNTYIILEMINLINPSVFGLVNNDPNS